MTRSCATTSSRPDQRRRRHRRRAGRRQRGCLGQVSISGRNGFFSPDAPRAGRRGQPVTVHYATADGTATAGKDYTRRRRHPHLRSRHRRDHSLRVCPDLGRRSRRRRTRRSWSTCPPRSTASLQRATATITITDTPPPAPEPGYVPLTPVRLLDTRNGTGAPAGFAEAGSITELQVSGAAGIPGTAKAVVLNATVVATGGSGVSDRVPVRTGPPDHEQHQLQRGPDDREHGCRGVAGQRKGVSLHPQEGSPAR